MYVCVCATHDKPNTSLPSVKYVVISFTGSAAQHSFGFFFFWASFHVCVLWTICLTALRAKFYVRMLFQV